VLLADSISTAQDFVRTLFNVYLVLIIAYIITSWIRLPYNLWLNRVQRFLFDVVDPYLRIFRRFVPGLPLGGAGLDLSPVFAIILLLVLRELVPEGIGLLR
jgi:YggT family protein